MEKLKGQSFPREHDWDIDVRIEEIKRNGDVSRSIPGLSKDILPGKYHSDSGAGLSVEELEEVLTRTTDWIDDDTGNKILSGLTSIQDDFQTSYGRKKVRRIENIVANEMGLVVNGSPISHSEDESPNSIDKDYDWSFE